jgi:dihydrodipicolinate synthase/N-acetylneuraminate lyase
MWRAGFVRLYDKSVDGWSAASYVFHGPHRKRRKAMKTSPVTPEDLSASVLAVPPLALNADFSLNIAANRALIRHLEAGGVTTLLYGGNANFYNLGIGDYPRVLDMLEEAAAPGSWVIPSIGPDYGRMMDQVAILKGRAFPTAMALPQRFPATPAGVETGLKRATDAYGKPLIVYLRAEDYLPVEALGRLVEDGRVCAVKYAVDRADPAQDAWLARLADRIGPERIVSGMGERPAVAHLSAFGLAGFTSGSVCIAPRSSSALLAALKRGDMARAERIRALFLPLEDLRDRLNQIRVLHDAVTLSGIADMGPILPLLSNIEPEYHDAIRRAALSLKAVDAESASVAA